MCPFTFPATRACNAVTGPRHTEPSIAVDTLWPPQLPEAGNHPLQYCRSCFAAANSSQLPQGPGLGGAKIWIVQYTEISRNVRVLELSTQKSKAFQGEDVSSSISTAQIKTSLIYLKIQNFRIISGFTVVMKTILLTFK